MGQTALVLGDQLMAGNPALEGAERVLMVESRAAMGRLRYHRQRLHLVLSAMRHRAEELRQEGREVVYASDQPSFDAPLKKHRGVTCAEPNSARTRRALAAKGVEFVPSNQFLTSPAEFATWADQRKRLVMEDFYREQRRRFGVLMTQDDEPAGGRWNFDQENRRPPQEGLSGPKPYQPREDQIDAGVRKDLDRWGIGEYDDGPRRFAATHAEAKRALKDFTTRRLAEFGPWQDAMPHGERFLFHSLLSAPLNLGLLDPLDAVRAAERAYRDGDAPLASVEGFVRQILGWREYVWGMYWLRERQWPKRNALRAQRSLPEAFWSGETELNCLHDALGGVKEHAYAHHIHRLMVLGNTLLLTGVKPAEAVDWFQAAFIDGAEWVMWPNAAGMALWADGGEMMTKPYAAGGNYVNKMSRHCPGCRFDPKQRTGEDACPLTALYWDFMARHADGFAGNRRMQMPLKTLERMPAEERAAVQRRARAARRALG